MGMGGRGVVRMGLLGRSGAGSCPNLLQRRPAAGSAAGRSAEYQRFSFGAPVRSGPLQQIWTTCVVAGPWEGCRGPGGGRGGRPRAPRRALRTRKCSFNRHFRELNAHLGEEAGRSRSSRTAVPIPPRNISGDPTRRAQRCCSRTTHSVRRRIFFPVRAGVLHIGGRRPCGPVESFPHDSAVFPRTAVFSGRAPMCRGGRSAHGRISMALNTEVFPHDSADLPRAGPGRMCSAAPTVPRTAHWARHRRPDTPDPAARATTPRGSPEKPRPGVRPRRRPHLTTPNPASEPRRLLGGRWCGGGGASLSVVAIPAGPQAGSWRRLLLGPLKFRWTTVFREPGGPTELKWSNRI